MENRYKCIVVVSLMLTRENNGKNEVLLALRKNTGYSDGNFELPGGHIEAGEDLIQAMIREAKEELNIELKREDLIIRHVFHKYHVDRINFLISANSFCGELKVGETDKCEKIEWFDIENLPENLSKSDGISIKEVQNGVFYENSDYLSCDI